MEVDVDEVATPGDCHWAQHRHEQSDHPRVPHEEPQPVGPLLGEASKVSADLRYLGELARVMVVTVYADRKAFAEPVEGLAGVREYEQLLQAGGDVAGLRRARRDRPGAPRPGGDAL